MLLTSHQFFEKFYCILITRFVNHITTLGKKGLCDNFVFIFDPSVQKNQYRTKKYLFKLETSLYQSALDIKYF